MNILVVEDNRHMRRMLVEMMRTAFDHSPVFEAVDGDSALACCHEARPDLVLMDVGLPGANGIELTVEIKALLPDSKVVIISNYRTRASTEAAKAAGASAYVFKDEVYERLLDTLTEVLRL